MEKEEFENVITDKKLKEQFGDLALGLLANQKLIELNQGLKHLVVEFGYLFKTNNSNNKFSTMFKVILPNAEKIFYFGTQDGKLCLLNDNFTEETFKKIQKDMFKMHKVNIDNINLNDYKMELY